MGNDCSGPTVCNRPIACQKTPTNSVAITSAKSSCQSIERFHKLVNNVAQRRWTVSQNSFICPEKFFSHYKEYLREQTFVSEIWSNIDLDDDLPIKVTKRSQSQSTIPHLKLLIRTGVPLDKLRDIILEVFGKTYSLNDVEYECALKVAFNGNIPETFKNVPLFSYSNQIEDVLQVHFLNSQGLEAFKRIMWVYEKNVFGLEYSPLLSQVVALLLLFLNEDETYCVVKEMLEQSDKLLSDEKKKEGMKSLKWHLTLTKDQFEVFLESLSNLVKDRASDSTKLWKHFEKMSYDCNDLFWQLLKTLFLGYLPLPLVLKIFTAYLNEGIKIYYRFTLALLKLFEEEILQCTTSQSIMTLLKEKCHNITKAQIQILISTAYNLNLKGVKRRLPSIHPQTFHAPESCKLYYPQLSNASLTSTLHFESIWEWLPSEFKLTNPVLAYSSKVHGWSLQTLYSKCNEHVAYRGLLLLIETTDSVTIGAFVDGVVHTTGSSTHSFGSEESFVFQLEPEEKKFGASKKNNIFLVCDKEFLSIGSGLDGPAIYVADDLMHGYSYRSETYDNEPLHQRRGNSDTRFEVAGLELYWIE